MRPGGSRISRTCQMEKCICVTAVFMLLLFGDVSLSLLLHCCVMLCWCCWEGEGPGVRHNPAALLPLLPLPHGRPEGRGAPLALHLFCVYSVNFKSWGNGEEKRGKFYLQPGRPEGRAHPPRKSARPADPPGYYRFMILSILVGSLQRYLYGYYSVTIMGLLQFYDDY